MSKVTKVIKKSVNSKILFKEIDEFIQEAIYTIGISWNSSLYRESFVDLIEGWMLDELMGDGKITQVNVMCDERNNPPSKVKLEQYSVLIKYKQRNCLNTTSIEYIIDGSSDNSEKQASALIYP